MKKAGLTAWVMVVVVACGDSSSPATVDVATTVAVATTDSVVATTSAPTASPTTTTTTTTTPPTTTAEPSVVVLVADFAGGEVETDTDRAEIALGSTVEIRVTSDVAEEVHLHGYDLFVDVEPGGTGTLTFVADIPGIFEVELEESRQVLFELEVS